jgi:hypothetical protein
MSVLQAGAPTGALTDEELARVSGGGIDVVVDDDYVGIEVSIGGFGFGIWVTGGSLCGSYKTPWRQGSGCT